MGVEKKENRIKKMKQRIKMYEASNSKMADNLKGKLAGVEGKKRR
jgi:hypothetical protein